MKPTDMFVHNMQVLEEYLAEWGLEKHFAAMRQAYQDCDERALAYAAHYAWEALPDRPSIHSYGFSELCDIAENIFASDEELFID